MKTQLPLTFGKCRHVLLQFYTYIYGNNKTRVVLIFVSLLIIGLFEGLLEGSEVIVVHKVNMMMPSSLG
jgi:hypothetical protein